MTSTAARIETDQLANLFPFQDLTREERIIVAARISTIRVGAGKKVISRGSTDGWAYYLLAGRVRLEPMDGRHLIVESGTKKAQFPISALHPHTYTITTLCETEILRVEKSIFQTAKRHGLQEQDIPIANEMPSTEDLRDYPLFRHIYEELQQQKLKIPSLPAVAVKIRRAAFAEDADARKLTKMIQMDPAITAKMVKAANSVLYRGHSSITSCQDAVVRLGLRTTSSLVTSFAMRDVFRTKTKLLRERMKEVWQHSAKVAAISHRLASTNSMFESEQALLAGLLHDIGAVSVLAYAEQYDDVTAEADALDATLTHLKGELGALILKRWGFDDVFVTVAREAENWLRDPSPQPDYCDLIIIAQMHSFVGTPKMSTIPAMYHIPAFNKLALGELTPELSLKMLNKAQEHIDRLERWLTF